MLVLLALSDVAPGLFQAPPPPVCTEDAACKVSTFTCCPTCCPPAPRGVLKTKNEAELCPSPCPKFECAADPVCPPVQPASEYVAVCRRWEGCLALPIAHPTACKVDTDCVAIVAMPPMGARTGKMCADCPFTQAVTAHAGVTAADPAKLRRYSIMSDKKGVPPETVTCPPCPPAKKATARCEQGKCKLVP